MIEIEILYDKKEEMEYFIEERPLNDAERFIISLGNTADDESTKRLCKCYMDCEGLIWGTEKDNKARFKKYIEPRE
jgi:hypothetical protein